MEEILELKKKIADQESTIKALDKQLARYELDGPVGFYYELNRWVNATREFMKGKTVESLMNGEKDDQTFTRTMALIKSAKENIEALAEMRKMFDAITGSEDDDAGKKIAFIDRLAVKRTI
jgi:hypothetical protein